MNSIAVSNLAEGQRYSEPVYIEGESLLVEAKVPLRKKDLDLLASLGVNEVRTEGFLLPPEETGSNGESGLPPLGTESVYKRLGNLIKQTDVIFRGIHESSLGVSDTASREKKISVRQLWTISSVLLQIVKEERAACLGFILSGAYKSYQLAKSAVNTAILSIAIARDLELPIERIPEIAAGALLHDIGMTRLPSEITGKAGGLTAEEVALIRSHTALSYSIITRELAYSPAVGTIALQHHERWDGTGYPHRLVGNAIDSGARIVCIADAFEAMICEKPYRNPMLGYLAMKNVVSGNSAHFAPLTLKSFVRVLGMYPIGSGGVLNDGRVVRIVDVRPELPLRPVVQIIADANEKLVKDGEKIDLSTQKQIFIAQATDINSFDMR